MSMRRAVTGDDLGELLLRAYIARLNVRWAADGRLVVNGPDERPLTASSQLVPLDDTARPPVVPLRDAGGDVANPCRRGSHTFCLVPTCSCPCHRG